MAGATPDSLLAFHDAGYRESPRPARARAPCSTSGAASATRRSASPAPDRRVIGIDYDADTTAIGTSRPLAPKRAAVRGHGRRIPRDRRTTRSTGCARRTSSSTSPLPSATSPRSRVCCTRRRHRVRDHPEPRLPTSRTRSTCTCSRPTSSSRCCACSSTTCRCTGSRAHPSCTTTSPAGAPAARSCCKLDPLRLRQRVPRGAGTCTATRACCPSSTRCSGSARTGHRLGHRRVALLPQRHHLAHHPGPLRRRPRTPESDHPPPSRTGVEVRQ